VGGYEAGVGLGERDLEGLAVVGGAGGFFYDDVVVVAAVFGVELVLGAQELIREGFG